MQMSPGEIFDRWTILRQKARVRDDQTSELKKYELEAYSWIFKSLGFQDATALPALCNHILTLMEANSKIWMLEASIRKSEANDPVAKEELPLEEVGRRTYMIRDFNKMRVQAKADIDKMFSFVPDVKVDHASESK